MKIIYKIKETLLNTKIAIKRFPFSVMFTFMFSIFMVIWITMSNISYEERQNEIYKMWEKVVSKSLIVIFLGILISLALHLIYEILNEKYKNNYTKIFLSLFTLGVLAYLFNIFYNEEVYHYITRGQLIFILLTISLISFGLYVGKLKSKGSIVPYSLEVLRINNMSFFYGLILFLGISGIIFTISSLFNIVFSNKIYEYIFALIVFPFSVLIFLSQYPKPVDSDENYVLPKEINILLSYIVIPLSIIYMIILYAYLAKIIIIGELPKGKLTHLILWFAFISVITLFLISGQKPKEDEDKKGYLIHKFKKIFSLFFIPQLILLFISIFLRINQYGITKNRYFLLLGAIWVSISFLNFLLFPKSKNIVIMALFSIMTIIPFLEPFGVFTIETKSQGKIIKEVLLSNNMIKDNKIIPNTDLSFDDLKKLSSAFRIITRNNNYKKLKNFPDNLFLDDYKKDSKEHFADIIGSKMLTEYEVNSDIQRKKSFYYYLKTDFEKNSININEYEAMHYIQGYGVSTARDNNHYPLIKFIFDKDSNLNLEILLKENGENRENKNINEENSENRENVNINEEYKENKENKENYILIDKIDINLFIKNLMDKEDNYSMNDLGITGENDKYKYKIIFYNLSFRSNEKIEVDLDSYNYSAFILFKKK